MPASETWLYKCAAKGIQGYILSTNKLKDMAGGSELVESLGGRLEALWIALGITGVEIIYSAAGGAALVLQSEDDARKLALHWPLAVSRFAPGVQVAQAVVQIQEDLSQAMQKAEDILRANRNMASPDLPEAGPLVVRSRRSGLPAVNMDSTGGEKEYLDAGQARKREAVKPGHLTLAGKVIPKSEELSDEDYADRWPLMFDQISGSERECLAVVHIDANGLGQVVMKLGRNSKAIVKFSKGVAEATEAAAREATGPIAKAAEEEAAEKSRKSGEAEAGLYPLRPIVLAGDDVTMVMRARDALAFAKAFLEMFEMETEALLSSLSDNFKVDLGEKLTACAGIAFVKRTFPFALSHDLAESLCKHAKQETERKHSALSFFHVTTAMTDKYGELVRSELTTGGGAVLTMNPYVLHANGNGGRPDLDKLESLAKAMKALPRGGLRNLVSTAYDSPELAQSAFNRVCDVCKGKDAGKYKDLKEAVESIVGKGTAPHPSIWTTDEPKASPLYDAIVLNDLDCFKERKTSGDAA